MADMNVETSTVATEGTTTVENKELDLMDMIDGHLDFNPIVDEKFISANEFCSQTSSIFKSIFGDYEGCTFGVVQNSDLVAMQLYFNHKGNPSHDKYTALTREIAVDNTKNKVLHDLRARQARLNAGDKWYLTEEAQQMIKKALIPGQFLFKKDNSVQWNKCVFEVSDPNNRYPYGGGDIYTKVDFIDPTYIAALLYGDDDKKFVYTVRIARSVPTSGIVGVNSDFVLAIGKISDEETKKLARQYGLNFNNGLNIIR